MALAAGSAAGAAAFLAPGAQAANFPVTNTTDAGAGSLRQAVLSANAAAGADTVTATGISGTITLTTGEIEVTDSVTITGPGAASLTVSGDADNNDAPSAADSRIFYITDPYAAPETNVSISGLTIAEGYAEVYSYTYGPDTNFYGSRGGGIISYGAGLSLDGVTLTDNTASSSGGGISAGGDQPISVTNSTISGNIAFGNSAGASLVGSATTVSNSTISGNIGIGEDPDPAVPGGSYSNIGGLSVSSPTTNVTNVTVSGNSATTGVGGLRVYGYSYGVTPVPVNISVSDSTISGNVGGGDGGANIGGYGDGTVEINAARLNVSGNTGAEGAGGLDLGNAKLTASTISGNRAAQGTGGVDLGRGSIDSSTISGNTGAIGGVRAEGDRYSYDTSDNPQRTASIVNSTISGNSAQSVIKTFTSYYAPYTTTSYTYGGRGGGVAAYGELVSVRNSTIAGNSANLSGGGVNAFDFDNPGYAGDDADNAIGLSSTIVADNTVGGAPNDLGNGFEPDPNAVSATFAAGSSLLETPGATPITTAGNPNTLGVDPILGPLANNGGPTLTQALALSSPGIDSGTGSGLNTDEYTPSGGGTGTDQRGQQRTVDVPAAPNSNGSDGTDIGAFELTDISVAGANVKAKKSQSQKPKKIKIKVVVGADDAVTAEASGAVSLGKAPKKGDRAKAKPLKLKPVTANVEAGKTRSLVLKLKKKSSNNKAFKALAKGQKVTAKLQVVLTDAVGNTVTKKPKVKLKLKKAKKPKK